MGNINNNFSYAEKRAEAAEDLKPFLGFKLLKIRNTITELLNNIKTNGFFIEYTKHDISHIDEMLNIADWLIPESTKETMNDSEWLMLVLSIYFHDLGMLITKKEYENKNNTLFKEFKSEIMNAKESAYHNKISQLKDPDKFLYEEFVRRYHPTRIKHWIEGDINSELGIDKTIIETLQNDLSSFNDLFKRDLAKICESHHLNDLDDITKYKIDMKYGNDKRCVVNLNYIATILRTADLLHITYDRTPSIEYKIINPSDPKSIIEWQKQSAVSAISPQRKIVEVNGESKEIQADTIEITGLFKNSDMADAYFGLSSYLKYARDQIKRSNEIIKKIAKEKLVERYEFPWVDINEESIETKGFERRKFEFTIDQKNILNLLVGHTLYNDTSVVLREIIQNSIDAIGVQNEIEIKNKITNKSGEISIKWNTANRELSFCDDGTGMSFYEIENFLLKVGASKYESEDFKKSFSDFAPISRFGIGILTCFLISDEIDIYTNSEKEELGIVISLRNVQGKYLIKKIEKNKLDKKISKHGTIVSLKVRHNIAMEKIEDEIKKWIVFPQYPTSIQVNDLDPVTIGYKNPKEALEDYIKNLGITPHSEKVEIRERQLDGVDFAFAVKYDKFFDEWSFLTNSNSNSKNSPIGSCIKGVRVEFSTPGFNQQNIIAAANFYGKEMPKTNVARSEFESINEQERLLSKIYKIYGDHIQEQIDSLHKGNYSLAWAVAESNYLIAPLLYTDKNVLGYKNENENENYIKSKKVLFETLNQIKGVLIERSGERVAVSPKEIQELSEINIINGEMINAAEKLLKEIKTPTTLKKLFDTIGNKDITLGDNLFCNYSNKNQLHINALQGKEVAKISINKEYRRVDYKYQFSNNRWVIYDLDKENNRKLFLPISDIATLGFDEQIGVIDDNITYLINCDFTEKLKKIIAKFDINKNEDKYLLSVLLITIIRQVRYNLNVENDKEKIFESNLERQLSKYSNGVSYKEKLWQKVNKSEMLNILNNTSYELFNPSSWYRANRNDRLYW